ncbi:MAG: helix-turn-helix domain-containing protein [Steroidobacteraceae bacterium]
MREKPKASAQPLTVSVKGAADLLGVGRDAIYKLIETGELRTVPIGKMTRIPSADLPAFIERHAAASGINAARQEKARAARRGGSPTAEAA